MLKNRPNRFIAEVDLDGKREIVHVKNTGRCREILIPGCSVYLTAPDSPNRKTKYDLVAARKKNGMLFNIDSQAPNKVVKEWLESKDYTYVKPEYTYGASRIDFFMKKGDEEYLMEVKGCTLEIDGVGYFPDAPTARGVKHVRELIKAKKEGYRAILAFVIQMEGVDICLPNKATDPDFSEVIEEAKKEGVEILYLRCRVKEDELYIDE
ncbi:DNA/RNA nuclease SfsA [Lachnobacterium bovis]|uniref:Sugar fermentation stimulation protein homolog n=1 Tax=Lachnobacterium bovis DSM 14045 TaxID=1122142 RepID=A0A1H3KZN6_9FIRM|nr:DNA/RNA nuclease SfsA [Lachnobacterium bovis]SDY57652.1 sugar fermentation stimulation protein A [Lachnobacterium bovis DSM 14045]